MNLRRGLVGFFLSLCLFCGFTARAQNNTCEAGESPDLIIGDVQETTRYGVVGNITAFAIGNNTCNQGTCQANWNASTGEHPVFAQNMFRLKDDRFEQIGQSWVKHGFTALQQTLCSSVCRAASSGSYLGVNCSDPYSASLNGSQARLGPKFEVNPATGVFPYPPTNGSQTGDTIYKRLQVHNSDLDPALNPGAKYFVEIQVVAHDDATGLNQQNNATYRPVNVTAVAGAFDIALTAGASQRQKAAIEAWGALDPSVVTTNITDGANGRIVVAAKATSLFATWRYEYAVQNLTSARAIRSFRVPIPAGALVRNVGFHDVDYHSGEPFSGTDWTATVDANFVTWTTDSWATNPNANALRWGTLYNFRFDINVAPVTDDVRLDLFTPGSPGSVTASILTPNACVVNGVCEGSETCANCPADCAGQGGGAGCCGNLTCEAGENPCRCAADCGTATALELACNDLIDNDCDGQIDCLDLDCCTAGACAGSDHDGDGFAACDCNDSSADAWSTPGVVLDLALAKGAGSETVLSWQAPANPGGLLVAIVYDAIRSVTPADFVASASCLPVTAPGVTTTSDLSDPGAGGAFFYLVRATNACPSGDGPLGTRSNGTPRDGRSCP
jgi:hypothetical protein